MTDHQIMLPHALEAWAQSRVGDGCYASIAEYLYDLVRRDQDRVSSKGLAGNMTSAGLSQS